MTQAAPTEKRTQGTVALDTSATLTTDSGVDRDALRTAIRAEYRLVADEPNRGFHFHTGRALTQLLDYEPAWLSELPEAAIASFAGTGNPFALGALSQGSRVVDIGSGAGLDSLIAAGMVGPSGRVVGVDMTDEMLARARQAGERSGRTNLEFRKGYGEELPIEDGWADLVISNGVLNLMPDKKAAAKEMARVVKPGGRLQIADILVQKPVSVKAKARIELWTG